MGYNISSAHQLVTSGLHRNATEVRPFWRDLYQAKADVILNGHSHHYERFAPQNPDGAADLGTWHHSIHCRHRRPKFKSFWRKQANSVIRNGRSFGVLELELLEKSYTWSFISERGEVLDSGYRAVSFEAQSQSLKKGLYEPPSTSKFQRATYRPLDPLSRLHAAIFGLVC